MVNAPSAMKPLQLQLHSDKKPCHEELPPSRTEKTKMTLILCSVYAAGHSGVQLKDFTAFFVSVVLNRRRNP